MLICDTHADTLHAMQDASDRLPYDVTAEYLTANPNDTRVQALALWTGRYGLKLDDEGVVERELEQLERLKTQGWRQITHIADAERGKANVLLTIEGGEVFEAGLHTVDLWADKGVRMAAIVWNNDNALADSAAGGSLSGLSAYGRAIVSRMNERHMAVDVSHLNEAGFADLLRLSRAPIAASHSCCRALCEHVRNLTDEQLRALFDMGGYVGVNFYPTFLSASGMATVDTVVEHIEHMMELGGERCVGIGSDFDGIETHPQGLENAGCLGNLIDAMRRHGFQEETVEAVMGQNLKRYLENI